MTEGRAGKAHPVMGSVCILASMYLGLAATGIFDSISGDGNAPPWVIAVCGLVFLIAGLVLWIGADSALSNLGAFLICTCLGSVGVWAALFAPAGSLRGGLVFLSQAQNELLGKAVFGVGSVITFAIAIYALRRLISDEKRTD